MADLQTKEDLFNIVFDFQGDFEQLTSDTKADGFERGFSVCRDINNPDRLTKGEIVIGKKTSVEIPGCFMTPSPGSFHTHPTGEAFPSHSDLINSRFAEGIIDSDEIICVGSPDEEVARCVSVKDSLAEIKLQTEFERKITKDNQPVTFIKFKKPFIDILRDGVKEGRISSQETPLEIDL